MFRPLLRSVVEQVPGVLGVVFCDEEGEAVDYYAAELVDEYEVRVMGASWSLAVDLLRRNLEARGPGSTAVVWVGCERYTYFVVPVGSTYFLAVWARGDVALGKGLAVTRGLVRTLEAEV